MTYREMYMRDFDGAGPKGCPYHYGYEQYTVPIETNGCIHKRMHRKSGCASCWDREAFPYKIGDVVQADDGVMRGVGVVMEIIDSRSFYEILIAFPFEGYPLHSAASSSINVEKYEENIFRFYDMEDIELIPGAGIENVMSKKKFINLLRLGYE